MYGITANADVMSLEIISGGLYSLELTFDTKYYDELKKFNWCYEAGKGQAYAMDLTMEMPTKMGYHTPRIYLRDYLLHLAGYAKGAIWHRKHLSDYKLDERDIRQNKT